MGDLMKTKAIFFIVFFLSIKTWAQEEVYEQFDNANNLIQYYNPKSYIKVAKSADDCLFGLKNQDSVWILPSEYTFVENYVNGYAIVNKDMQYGVVDKEGKFVIPLQNKIIRNVEFDKFYFGNSDWPEDISNKLEYFNDFKGNFIVEDSLKGILNVRQKEIIPCKYNYLNVNFWKYNFVIAQQNELKYLLDTLGNILAGENMDVIDFYPLYENPNFLYFRNLDGKRGVVSSVGKIMINPFFDHIYHIGLNYSKKMIMIKENNSLNSNIHFFDLNGNKLGVFRNMSNDYYVYEDLSYYNLIRLNSNYFLINDRGKIILKDIVQVPGYIKELCVVNKDNVWSLYDLKGNKKLKNDYDYLGLFYNYLLVKKNNLYGVIDTTEKVVIPFEYQYIDKYGYDFIKDSLVYQYNNSGIKMTLNSEKSSKIFKNEDDLFGFINNGKMIFAPVYDSIVYHEKREFVEVFKEGVVTLFDINGKVLLSAKAKRILPINYDYFSIHLFSNKSILLSSELDTIATLDAPVEYFDDVHNLFYIKVERGYYGVLNAENKLIVDTIYGSIGYLTEGSSYFWIRDKTFSIEKDFSGYYYLDEDNIYYEGWSLVDTSGRIYFQNISYPSNFCNGIAVLNWEDSSVVIGNNLNVLIQPFIGKADVFGDFIWTETKIGCQFYNLNGITLPNYNFTKVVYVNEDYILVFKGEIPSLMNTKGIFEVKGIEGNLNATIKAISKVVDIGYLFGLEYFKLQENEIYEDLTMEVKDKIMNELFRIDERNFRKNFIEEEGVYYGLCAYETEFFPEMPDVIYNSYWNSMYCERTYTVYSITPYSISILIENKCFDRRSDYLTTDIVNFKIDKSKVSLVSINDILKITKEKDRNLFSDLLTNHVVVDEEFDEDKLTCDNPFVDYFTKENTTFALTTDGLEWISLYKDEKIDYENEESEHFKIKIPYSALNKISKDKKLFKNIQNLNSTKQH
jgi:hypothetical protein